MLLIDTSCSLAELILILIDMLSKLKLDTTYLISIDNGIDIEMERKPAKIGRKLIRKPRYFTKNALKFSKQWIVQL